MKLICIVTQKFTKNGIPQPMQLIYHNIFLGVINNVSVKYCVIAYCA